MIVVALDVVVAIDDDVVLLLFVVQDVIADVVVDACCQMFEAISDYVCVYLCFPNIF